jgi:biotin operon repressor
MAPDDQQRTPLVTVQFETETDLRTGRRDRRMFVKLYFEARDSGLLAAIPDRLWKMLCAMATYMDEHGHCSPSQARIAKDLGIGRQNVNERIQELLAFRFQGEPVIVLEGGRKSHGRQGAPRSRFAVNRYRIDGISGLGIFQGNSTMSSKGDMVDSHVGGSGDMERAHHVAKGGSTMSPHGATLTRSRTRSDIEQVIHKSPEPEKKRICTHQRRECGPGFCYYDERAS